MNLYDFQKEYTNLSLDRRREVMSKLFDTVLEDLNSIVAMEMLAVAVDYEADDFFGTEGFRCG